MNYEPRGKVAALINAMRARPQKEFWTSQEVSLEMDVHQASLTAHLGAAIRNGALHRRMDGNGRCQYSAKPFQPSEPLEIPQFIPPRMVAPREGSDIPLPSVHPTPAPTEAPAPAPAPAAAEQEPEPEPAPAPPQEEEEEEEQIQPDAFLSVQTGDWTLVGCEVDEEGRVTVPAALMAKIKAQMVWSVLR